MNYKFIFTSKFLIGFVGCMVLLAFSHSSSYAQTTDEIIVKGKVLYSDQVNALKTPVPILNVPQSLSIVTDEDIRAQGFRSIGDIARYTPGVNTSQGEGHRDAIVFRGVRSTADFYLDGMRDDVQYYRSLYNLEQVEILRGPNALLFGRGGTGGIINRVTKKGKIGEDFGSIDLGFDTFGAYDFSFDVNTPLSENMALRINAHNDYLENHRDYYDGDRYGFNPTLKIKLGDKTTLDLSYEHANHERFIDRGIPTANGVPVEKFEKIVFGDPDINIQTLKADIAKGILSHEFSDTMKGNITVQYSDYEKMYQNLYAAGYDATTNVVTMDGYRDPTERRNFIISGNLVTEFDTGSVGHTILLGAENMDTENENFRFNTFFSVSQDDQEDFNVTRPMKFSVNAAGDASTVDFTTDLSNKTTSDIKVTSFFIQDQIDLTDQFKIMLGGRFDSFDITVVDVDDAVTTSRKDEEFSPRAGIIFKPQENTSFFVSYSESFLPRSGEQFKKLSASAARLDPDVFENTEVGFKWDIQDDLSFTLSYFDSEQVQAVRDSVTGETSEITGLTVDGFEMQLKGQVSDKLSITAGYSNMEGETSSGGAPREIPETTFSLWSMYEVNDKFGLGLGITYQDESFIKNNDTSKKLPDYERIDLAAYYNVSEETTITLNVENLTDELYFPHSHSSHQASVGEPLNARVSLRRNF
ncbi:MAG: TonB-dependent siderophore receptor [Paracoccaceae bacterium]|nr:TonB-dependent siderophore receptor [Paracoccaceae bacterium]